MDTISRLYEVYRESRVVTTDSRAIAPGCIFFAFKGEKFDGNAFAPQALEQGAALCVVSDPEYAKDPRCILVPDVLKTLQDLASYHRDRLAIPVVGITGTNGKTTTKELVHAVLSKRYKTSATQGNFNNHLGVPLTLLAIPKDAEIAIVEMGANHPGEIAALCEIAKPDFGLITNVGKAHLEGFGSFEGVIRTKTELYRHLASVKGTIFVNADNEILMEQAEKLATIPEVPSLIPAYAPGQPVASPRGDQLGIVTYGQSEESEIKGSYISSDPYMKLYFEEGDNVYTVQSQLLGGYNFDNAMAAIAVGMFFGVERFSIKEAIEQYAPSNKRSQFKRTNGNGLLLDCYNANPSSMGVAIRNFESLSAEHKVVMLGGMKELGADSQMEHQNIVDLLKSCHFEQMFLVGPEFEFASNEAGFRWFADVYLAKEYLKENPLVGATILLKGSNSTRMWLLEENL